MDRLLFEDIYSLVSAVREHRELFPLQMNHTQAVNDLIAYYEKIFTTRKFTGQLRRIKAAAAKIPAVRMLFAYLTTKQIMTIYPQSRCDAYITDTIDDISKNEEQYIKAYELLEEDSKQIFIDLLLLRLTGDFTYMFPHVQLSGQYFSNKIKWKEHPNVLDCGAFIGDTFLAFYSMGIIPGHYYLYELDDANYKKLLDNIKGKENKVYPRKKGVAAEQTTLYYEALGDSSRLVPYETDQKIEVVKIDEDVKHPIDFIKMDIEGGEVPALEGARKIINQYHPTLAICIYHLKDDFWKIPLLIHELCPEYNRYWIEHYSPGYNETVLYVDVQ